jgi:hypothetical protein
VAAAQVDELLAAHPSLASSFHDIVGSQQLDLLPIDPLDPLVCPHLYRQMMLNHASSSHALSVSSLPLDVATVPTDDDSGVDEYTRMYALEAAAAAAAAALAPASSSSTTAATTLLSSSSSSSPTPTAVFFPTTAASMTDSGDLSRLTDEQRAVALGRYLSLLDEKPAPLLAIRSSAQQWLKRRHTLAELLSHTVPVVHRQHMMSPQAAAEASAAQAAASASQALTAAAQQARVDASLLVEEEEEKRAKTARRKAGQAQRRHDNNTGDATTTSRPRGRPPGSGTSSAMAKRKALSDGHQRAKSAAMQYTSAAQTRFLGMTRASFFAMPAGALNDLMLDVPTADAACTKTMLYRDSEWRDKLHSSLLRISMRHVSDVIEHADVVFGLITPRADLTTLEADIDPAVSLPSRAATLAGLPYFAAHEYLGGPVYRKLSEELSRLCAEHAIHVAMAPLATLRRVARVESLALVEQQRGVWKQQWHYMVWRFARLLAGAELYHANVAKPASLLATDTLARTRQPELYASGLMCEAFRRWGQALIALLDAHMTYAKQQIKTRNSRGSIRHYAVAVSPTVEDDLLSSFMDDIDASMPASQPTHVGADEMDGEHALFVAELRAVLDRVIVTRFVVPAKLYDCTQAVVDTSCSADPLWFPELVDLQASEFFVSRAPGARVRDTMTSVFGSAESERKMVEASQLERHWRHALIMPTVRHGKPQLVPHWDIKKGPFASTLLYGLRRLWRAVHYTLRNHQGEHAPGWALVYLLLHRSLLVQSHMWAQQFDTATAEHMSTQPAAQLALFTRRFHAHAGTDWLAFVRSLGARLWSEPEAIGSDVASTVLVRSSSLVAPPPNVAASTPPVSSSASVSVSSLPAAETALPLAAAAAAAAVNPAAALTAAVQAGTLDWNDLASVPRDTSSAMIEEARRPSSAMMALRHVSLSTLSEWFKRVAAIEWCYDEEKEGRGVSVDRFSALQAVDLLIEWNNRMAFSNRQLKVSRRVRRQLAMTIAHHLLPASKLEQWNNNKNKSRLGRRMILTFRADSALQAYVTAKHNHEQMATRADEAALMISVRQPRKKTAVNQSGEDEDDEDKDDDEE